MNNNEEQEFIEDRHYKLKAGKVYTIKRIDVEWKDTIIHNYSIGFSKKIKGNIQFFYKHVRFGVGSIVELKNNTRILINEFFEDCRRNPRDKYNDIFDIVITDYEVVEEPSDEIDDLIEYQSNIQDSNNSIVEDDDLITF
jgi:hypothetical protein